MEYIYFLRFGDDKNETHFLKKSHLYIFQDIFGLRCALVHIYFDLPIYIEYKVYEPLNLNLIAPYHASPIHSSHICTYVIDSR